MKPISIVLIALGLLIATSYSVADTVELKNGKKIEGKFIGREGDVVKFDVDGITMSFKASDVANISIGKSAAEGASSTTAAKPPVATPTPDQTSVIPAGTMLTVRLREQLSTSKHTKGHKFTATLEGALAVGDRVLVPAGSVVYGVIQSAKKAGRVAGKASMMITLTDIRVGGQIKPIATNSLSGEAASTAGKTAGTVAKGAALGGLMGGSSKAKSGAKIGAGLSILTPGNQMTVPSGTLFDFQLRTDFKP